ncbi:cytochrome P450 [Ktedonospora formicarum]|uniref:Cytochrome P450 n=1 Tax=Ktedonospora formicarum TaxID=2778364 RepID=A0A8J3HYX0_9CHLR|nr:cytochrome P450 [Ktedonospora formicarum]GHO46772.1 cytochrome P450 [Ktedonospora formicarum]
MATTMHTSKTIPGPRTLPLLGWRASIFKLYSDPFRYLSHLYATYGPVVTLSKGDASYICAFGPELNFALLSNPTLFEVSAGPMEKLAQDTALVRVGGHSLQMMRREKHKQQRRLMQPAFHKQQVAHLLTDMVTLTSLMLDSWQERTEIQLYREMELLTRDIVVKTLFGLDDKAEIEHLGSLLERMVSSLMLALIAPVNLPGTPYARMQHMAEELETALQAMIARKRSQGETTDLLSVLIHAHDEDGATLSDLELVSHAFTLFTAGHATTTDALTWALFLLSQHPQVTADLLDEVDGVLHGEAPTIEQLQQLPLLDYVIKESLRLLPPGGIGQRKAMAPCELEGYELAEGTTIIYSEFLTHRLSELYEQPDRFLPQRWATLKRTAYEYLPFSAGQHRCIGSEFALLEEKITLAMLIQRYRLEGISNARIDLGLEMRPKHGMTMRIFPQDRQFKRVPVRGNIRDLVVLAE